MSPTAAVGCGEQGVVVVVDGGAAGQLLLSLSQLWRRRVFVVAENGAWNRGRTVLLKGLSAENNTSGKVIDTAEKKVSDMVSGWIGNFVGEEDPYLE